MIRGRGFIAVLLIVSVLATAGMQHIVRQRRETLVPRPPTASRFSGADTFALGLILGGLRGPLVMFLWTSSENRKAERNLEDVDTQIELIRMLQPEFDSVHIFQIWNKAYNLSVQMASLPNKYATILDAIEYARRVNAERPDNVNILASMGDVYFQKLSQSQEKRYYIRRMRRETLGASPAPSARDWRPMQHPRVLDSRGFILPEYLEPKWFPSQIASTRSDYNGAEYQYLARYNTPEAGGFPYGLSPTAIGYNYFERTRNLSLATGQTHLQMSDNVLDSRPAVVLRYWAEEEAERANRREIELVGKTAPESRITLPQLTLALNPADFIKDPAKARPLIEEAIYSYRRAAAVAVDARADYERHLANPDYAYSSAVYFLHVDTVAALAAISRADHQYLSALAAESGLVPAAPDAPSPANLRASALRGYQDAAKAYYILVLKYFTDETVLAAVLQSDGQRITGKKVERKDLDTIDPARLPALYAAVREFIVKRGLYDSFKEDVQEYEAYIHRAEARVKQLQR